jgi:hypothetical protein
MEVITSMDQGSLDWHLLRIGSLGGSRIAKAVAEGKDRRTRTQLLYDMVGEILEGEIKQGWQSKEMEAGLAYEDEARAAYCFHMDCEVTQIAMFKDGPNRHYSPDGVVGENGLIEIKTVIPSTFVAVKDTGKVDTGYRKQMQWGLRISGREWVDYAVYCPHVKDISPLYVSRQYRDEKEIAELEEGAGWFIGDMLELAERMRR